MRGLAIPSRSDRAKRSRDSSLARGNQPSSKAWRKSSETIEDRFATMPGARPAGGGVRDLLQRPKRVQWRHCLSVAGPLDRPVTIQFTRKGTFIGTFGGPFPARDRRLPDQGCP